MQLIGVTSAVRAPVWKYIASGLIFEIVWLACVLDPSSLLVVSLTLANLVLHFVLFHGSEVAGGQWRYCVRSFVWLAAVTLAGVVVDSILFRVGLFYTEPAPYTVPLWLGCLWLNFALAVRFAFIFLHGRILLAGLFGLVGGPLSYLIGAKLGDVSLAEPLWFTLSVLALVWVIILPLIVCTLPVETLLKSENGRER